MHESLRFDNDPPADATPPVAPAVPPKTRHDIALVLPTEEASSLALDLDAGLLPPIPRTWADVRPGDPLGTDPRYQIHWGNDPKNPRVPPYLAWGLIYRKDLIQDENQFPFSFKAFQEEWKTLARLLEREDVFKRLMQDPDAFRGHLDQFWKLRNQFMEEAPMAEAPLDQIPPEFRGAITPPWGQGEKQVISHEHVLEGVRALGCYADDSSIHKALSTKNQRSLTQLQKHLLELIISFYEALVACPPLKWSKEFCSDGAAPVDPIKEGPFNPITTSFGPSHPQYQAWKKKDPWFKTVYEIFQNQTDNSPEGFSPPQTRFYQIDPISGEERMTVFMGQDTSLALPFPENPVIRIECENSTPNGFAPYQFLGAEHQGGPGALGRHACGGRFAATWLAENNIPLTVDSHHHGWRWEGYPRLRPLHTLIDSPSLVLSGSYGPKPAPLDSSPDHRVTLRIERPPQELVEAFLYCSKKFLLANRLYYKASLCPPDPNAKKPASQAVVGENGRVERFYQSSLKDPERSVHYKRLLLKTEDPLDKKGAHSNLYVDGVLLPIPPRYSSTQLLYPWAIWGLGHETSNLKVNRAASSGDIEATDLAFVFASVVSRTMDRNLIEAIIDSSLDSKRPLEIEKWGDHPHSFSMASGTATMIREILTELRPGGTLIAMNDSPLLKIYEKQPDADPSKVLVCNGPFYHFLKEAWVPLLESAITSSTKVVEVNAGSEAALYLPGLKRAHDVISHLMQTTIRNNGTVELTPSRPPSLRLFFPTPVTNNADFHNVITPTGGILQMAAAISATHGVHLRAFSLDDSCVFDLLFENTQSFDDDRYRIPCRIESTARTEKPEHATTASGTYITLTGKLIEEFEVPAFAGEAELRMQEALDQLPVAVSSSARSRSGNSKTLPSPRHRFFSDAPTVRAHAKDTPPEKSQKSSPDSLWATHRIDVRESVIPEGFYVDRVYSRMEHDWNTFEADWVEERNPQPSQVPCKRCFSYSSKIVLRDLRAGDMLPLLVRRGDVIRGFHVEPASARCQFFCDDQTGVYSLRILRGSPRIDRLTYFTAPHRKASYLTASPIDAEGENLVPDELLEDPTFEPVITAIRACRTSRERRQLAQVFWALRFKYVSTPCSFQGYSISAIAQMALQQAQGSCLACATGAVLLDRWVGTSSRLICGQNFHSNGYHAGHADGEFWDDALGQWVAYSAQEGIPRTSYDETSLAYTAQMGGLKMPISRSQWQSLVKNLRIISQGGSTERILPSNQPPSEMSHEPLRPLFSMHSLRFAFISALLVAAAGCTAVTQGDKIQSLAEEMAEKLPGLDELRAVERALINAILDPKKESPDCECT